MDNQRKLGDIEQREIMLEEVKEFLEIVKREWEEFKLKVKEYREEELLHLHLLEISGETLEIK